MRILQIIDRYENDKGVYYCIDKNNVYYLYIITNEKYQKNVVNLTALNNGRNILASYEEKKLEDLITLLIDKDEFIFNIKNNYKINGIA